MTEQIYQSMIAEEAFESSEYRLEAIDWVALLLCAKFIAAILIIAGWSAIMLATGNTEGGGPLGVLARTLNIDCFLSLAKQMPGA